MKFHAHCFTRSVSCFLNYVNKVHVIWYGIRRQRSKFPVSLIGYDILVDSQIEDKA